MRGSVIGSGLFHVLLVVFLFLVRQPMNIVVPGPDVVQVSLVDPSAAVTPPAPPKVEPPKPEPETLKPLEEEGVKLEKPKPRKPEKPQPTPPPAKPTSAPALPSAAVGPPGLRADVGVDAGNFEYTYYLALVRDRIIGNWSPPAGISTGGREVRAEVFFKIGRHGEVSDVRIQVGSGVDPFDRSALRAVTISDPLPPLPLGFTAGHLGILFGLNWEAQ
jgi:TonB family protein